MTWFSHSLTLHCRKALLAAIVFFVHLSILAQFKDNYAILDSVIRYNFSSNLDSARSSRMNYETNEHGQSTAYTHYYFNQAESEWSPVERKEIVFDHFGRTDSVKVLRSDGTIAWEDSDLLSYTYGNSELPFSTVHFWWDANDHRLGVDSTCKKYDMYGGQTYLESYSWGTTTGRWYPIGKRTWVRDPDGLIHESVNYIWGIDSVWNAADKQEHFFDEHSLDTLTKDFGWDHINQAWKLYGMFRSERDFNTDGKVTECRTFSYDPAQEIWSTWGKTIYQNVLEGDTIHEETFLWNSGEWKPAAKKSTIVDDENRILYYEGYNWNYNLQKYHGNGKYIQTFSDSGQLIFDENYTWDWENETWVASSVFSYGFTPDGDQIFEKQYGWDQALNDWVPYYAYYCCYTQVDDLEAPQISMLNDSVVKGVPIELVCSQDAWVYLVPEGTGSGEDLEEVQTGKCELSGMTEGEMSTTLVTNDGMHLLYAVNSSGLVSLASRVWINITDHIQASTSMRKIQVYPTLVDENIYIRSEQLVQLVEIFDLHGRQLIKIEGNWHMLSLNLSWLDTGLYLIRCDRDRSTSVLISKQ